MVGPFGLRPLGTMSARALPLARILVERGHAVSVFLPPWQNPADSGCHLIDHGVVVENIRLPRRVPGVFHLATTARLARRVLRSQPDIIHAFKPKAYSGLVHTLLRLLQPHRGPPVVVDADDWEGPGGWNSLGDYTRAQRKVFAWQERWGFTHAQGVTVASRALEGLVWSMGIDPKNVSYVPNGTTERARIASAEGHYQGQSSAEILLYTRFVEFSIDRIVDLLSSILERFPEARLVVVGEGLHGEASSLAAIAESRGLAHAVRVLRYSEGEIARQMARVALAIYPLDDNLVNRAKSPAKLLELLSAGVPVVADAVGEAREFVRHGDTGWLVEPESLGHFSDAVVYLLREPDVRARMSAAAREDVVVRFSWERSADAVLRAYAIAGASR
jgi:glycosyltransferase involved in cell wall biosynthesis